MTSYRLRNVSNSTIHLTDGSSCSPYLPIPTLYVPMFRTPPIYRGEIRLLNTWNNSSCVDAIIWGEVRGQQKYWGRLYIFARTIINIHGPLNWDVRPG